ncbi:MAG: phospholipase [Alphaproteobacteria bacterium]|nr:phospholipase [Alphaproteobacteria bacterium]
MAERDGVRWGPRSRGQTAQLVVLCHGLGGDGDQLADLAQGWSEALPDALFVGLDGPEPCEGAPFGRQWFSIADRTPAVLGVGAASAATFLNPRIDAELARAGLPLDACALAGFSQGAMMALFAGLRRAPPPRAVLAYAGALLAPDQLKAELRGHPPVLLVHGEADDVVPAARSRDAERALGRLGVPVESLYCDGLGHGIDTVGIAAGAAFLRRAFGLL